MGPHMRTRVTTALLAALALLAAVPLAASAQAPTPTATPTPTAQPSQQQPGTAEQNRPKGVQRVYDDYRRDGVIDACAHSGRDLRATLRSIDPQFEQDYPDFRPAVEAAIETHRRGGGQGGAGGGRGRGGRAGGGRGVGGGP